MPVIGVSRCRGSAGRLRVYAVGVSLSVCACERRGGRVRWSGRRGWRLFHYSTPALSYVPRNRVRLVRGVVASSFHPYSNNVSPQPTLSLPPSQRHITTSHHRGRGETTIFLPFRNDCCRRVSHFEGKKEPETVSFQLTCMTLPI